MSAITPTYYLAVCPAGACLTTNEAAYLRWKAKLANIQPTLISNYSTWQERQQAYNNFVEQHSHDNITASNH